MKVRKLRGYKSLYCIKSNNFYQDDNLLGIIYMKEQASCYKAKLITLFYKLL